MITKEHALNFRGGEILHYGTCLKTIGLRGGETFSIEKWRVNGKTKTWKTRPGDFEVPLKHGMSGPHDYLNNDNAEYFHLEKDCKPNIHKTRKKQ